MTDSQQQSGGGSDLGALVSDAGRDRISVDVRLDKVVLAIDSDHGDRGQAELTPDDARRLREMLGDAIAVAEQTPR